jgi:AraC-like DNA-binding protein
MTDERPRYQEVRPSPPLAPFVQCYWCISAASASSILNRVCPDGCADIVIDLSPSLSLSAPGDLGRSYAVGTMRRAAQVPLAGRIHLFGVRFRPSAAGLFFGVPMHELTDRTVPLADLWNGAADLVVRLERAATLPERVSRVEQFLRDRLRRIAEPAPVVGHAVRFIARTGGAQRTRELERAVGVGGRQLERRFREAVGISPKAFARVIRFRRALAALRSTPVAWSRLATEAGYYDQAHLIREVRALAGVTPTALVAELRQVGFVQYETNVPD